MCLAVSISLLSFSRRLPTPTIGIVLSFILAFINDLDWRTLSKSSIAIFTLSLLPSFPSILLGTSVDAILAFIARVSSSTLLLIVIISILDWVDLVRGLDALHIPRFIVSSLTMTIVFIPKMLRELSTLLLAGQARITIDRSLASSWNIISKSVGDMIVRSFYTAWMLDKAIKARSIEAYTRSFHLRRRSFHLDVDDLPLLISTISLVIFFIISEMVVCF